MNIYSHAKRLVYETSVCPKRFSPMQMWAPDWHWIKEADQKELSMQDCNLFKFHHSFISLSTANINQLHCQPEKVHAKITH